MKADRGQIEQMVMNLAINARDAMPRGGTLSLETRPCVVEDGATASRPDGLRPGRYALLSVRDTGCGMDQEVLEHLFEPFYTTKEPGHGTGMGLSIVYGIVQQNHGSIDVESGAGRGTSFRVYLPRVEEAVDAPACPATEGQPRGSETVLLVEDDGAVRRLAADCLQHLGYTVIEATGGQDAIDVVGRHAAPVDLLLTDTVMPGLNGREVADRLTALRPGLKVLFMSGYTDDTVLRHGVETSALAFLHKPFTCADLARAVRGVLDGQET